ARRLFAVGSEKVREARDHVPVQMLNDRRDAVLRRVDPRVQIGVPDLLERGDGDSSAHGVVAACWPQDRAMQNSAAATRAARVRTWFHLVQPARYCGHA